MILRRVVLQIPALKTQGCLNPARSVNKTIDCENEYELELFK